jgi:hypothetical protein
MLKLTLKMEELTSNLIKNQKKKKKKMSGEGGGLELKKLTLAYKKKKNHI